MFRAAFPNATESDEKVEINWVRENYDLTGNNGSTRDTHITRLAGTWVSPQVAVELGKEYKMDELIKAVVEASPDPNGSYRRSGKAAPPPSYPLNTPSVAVNTGVPAPPTPASVIPLTTQTTLSSTTEIVTKPTSAVKSLPTPSPTAAAPPAKRRKESSPVPTPPSSKPPSRASPAPTKTPVRRSTRTKSPAPRTSVVIPLTSVSRTPKITRTAKKETQASTSLTPGGSDLTVVDEESQLVEDGIAGSELRNQDIKEQQKLIEDLKSKRDAERLAAPSAVATTTEEASMDVAEELSSRKRDREEETPLKFDFKEPEVEERVIATNRRVGRFHLEPRAKSFAWGIAAFAVGMGAV